MTCPIPLSKLPRSFDMPVTLVLDGYDVEAEATISQSGDVLQLRIPPLSEGPLFEALAAGISDVAIDDKRRELDMEAA